MLPVCKSLKSVQVLIEKTAVGYHDSGLGCVTFGIMVKVFDTDVARIGITESEIQVIHKLILSLLHSIHHCPDVLGPWRKKILYFSFHPEKQKGTVKLKHFLWAHNLPAILQRACVCAASFMPHSHSLSVVHLCMQCTLCGEMGGCRGNDGRGHPIKRTNYVKIEKKKSGNLIRENPNTCQPSGFPWRL